MNSTSILLHFDKLVCPTQCLYLANICVCGHEPLLSNTSLTVAAALNWLGPFGSSSAQLAWFSRGLSGCESMCFMKTALYSNNIPPA